MPIFDGWGNYIETALERDARMKLEISYQHTRDEKPYEVLNEIPVPNTNDFYLGTSIRASVLNSTLNDVGQVGNSSVLFSEESVFQIEIPYWHALTAPGQYKINYHSGRVKAFLTPSGSGVVSFAWSPFSYFIVPDWYEFSDPLCMHVCTICEHGNLSRLITGTGVGFASSPFYGGTHPPIFVYTGFKVNCALVAFEKEYDTLDVEYIYFFQSIARAASIRVGAITETGFYVEFKQIDDSPWVLEFNWMALGCVRATPDDSCECCDGAGVPPQLAIRSCFDGLIEVLSGICSSFDGAIHIHHGVCNSFDAQIHVGEAITNTFDGRLSVCVMYCCFIYDSDYWENRICPDSPQALPDEAINGLLQQVRGFSNYFDNTNLLTRYQACDLLHNDPGDTILDKALRFYLTDLLNVAVGSMSMLVDVDSPFTTATDFYGVVTDTDAVLAEVIDPTHDDDDDDGSVDYTEVERIFNLHADITLGDATPCLKINEESYRNEGDLGSPEPCGECDGKVTELTLQYLGSTADAHIKVIQKKDTITVFDDIVQPNGLFSFSGRDNKGTLSTEISIYIESVAPEGSSDDDDGGSTWILNTKIHTSCSKPIGPGLVKGDFAVVAGRSRNGGPLCEVAPNAQAEDVDEDDELAELAEVQATPIGIRRIALRLKHNYGPGPYITTVEAFRGYSTSINRRIDIEAGGEVPSGAVDANPGGLSGNIAILYTQLDQLCFDVNAKVNGAKYQLPADVTLRVTIEDAGDVTVYGPIAIHTSGSQLLSVGMSFGPFEIVELEKIF